MDENFNIDELLKKINSPEMSDTLKNLLSSVSDNNSDTSSDFSGIFSSLSNSFSSLSSLFFSCLVTFFFEAHNLVSILISDSNVLITYSFEIGINSKELYPIIIPS